MSRPGLNEPQFVHLFCWEWYILNTHFFFLSSVEIWNFKFHISLISTCLDLFVCLFVFRNHSVSDLNDFTKNALKTFRVTKSPGQSLLPRTGLLSLLPKS